MSKPMSEQPRRRHLYSSQVLQLCKEAYARLCGIYGVRSGDWEELTEREQALIETITDSVVRRIQLGQVPESWYDDTDEEGLQERQKST